MLGVADYDVANNEKKAYTNTGTYYYYGSNGQLRVNGTNTAFPNSTTYPYSNNDVIGIAFDCDNGTINFYLNGSKVGGSSDSITGLTGKRLGPALSSGSGNQSCVANFGARSFTYTAPSDYKALCTANLPDPTIADGSTAFDAKTFTANNGTQTISGFNFSPDLIWTKSRANAYAHQLWDQVRGTNKALSPNDTSAEANLNNSLAFTSDGFTSGTNNNANYGSGGSIAWAWDAGSSTVTNTDGSISSQVRANPSAGFSIVEFNNVPSGSAGFFSWGHGLGTAPGMVFMKAAGFAGPWYVYHSSTKGGMTTLNTTAAVSYRLAPAEDIEPGAFWEAITSTIVRADPLWPGASSGKMIAYCFAPVDGYSAFGSYEGNANNDGPFVYTGFRPAFVLTKWADGTDQWQIHDTSRSPDNVASEILMPNSSTDEQNYVYSEIDILSNGFKLRNSNQNINAASTYIYAAFAENPFKTSRAR
jgi:hypothetical protein